ncbi:MAG: prolipoprotein diacylglyceryl transferase [Oscillospiraceae bacterium]
MMTALLQAATAVTEEIEVEFPNLFGGFAMNYYRGFQLFGKVDIYWYGVIITLGVVLAYIYAMCRVKSFGLSKDRVFDVVFGALIGGFLGARIYYCVFQTLDPNSGVSYDFVTTFTTIRDGGLAIYGGIIGGFLVGFIMCKIRKVNFFAMCDIASFGFLIGQCLGRWGNFFNQEAYGSVTDPNYIFGMTGTIISKANEPGALVHPCFLYESVWCLLGFVALHFYSKKLRTFDGEITLMYIAWYGLGRAFIEGLRTDSLMLGDFRISQIVGAVSFVVAAGLFVFFKIYTEKKAIPLYVNTEASKAILEADAEELRKEAEKREEKRRAKEREAESILAPDADEIDEVLADDTPAEESAEESEEDTAEITEYDEQPEESEDISEAEIEDAVESDDENNESEE